MAIGWTMLRASGIVLFAAVCVWGVAAAWAGVAAPDDNYVPGPNVVQGNQSAQAAAAPDVAPATAPSGWIDWNGDNFFGPCRGDCSFALYGGREITTSPLRILYLKYPAVPPSKWHWGDSELAAATVGRRLVTFWNVADIEPEFGIGKRFGDMKAAEFWGAAAFRLTAFPWNSYVKTTIGVVEGLSFATQVEDNERGLSDAIYTPSGVKHTGSFFLNYCSPEATFALPEYDAYELLVRFHHRSGIFGLINKVHDGAQYATVGFRVRF